MLRRCREKEREGLRVMEPVLYQVRYSAPKTATPAFHSFEPGLLTEQGNQPTRLKRARVRSIAHNTNAPATKSSATSTLKMTAGAFIDFPF